MNNNNLQKLENEIRTALPELMELSEGCYLQHNRTVMRIVHVPMNSDLFHLVDTSDDDYCTIYRSEDKIIEYYKNLGHPVTILHLIKWLGEIGYGKLDTDFVLRFLGLDDMQLDYSKPLLRDQAPEVIDELCKLIN